MKKVIFVIFLLTFNLSMKSQNLSMQETIEYINNYLIRSSKIEINNSGSLIYSTLTKDYDLNILNKYNYTNDIEYETFKQKMETKKTIFRTHISDIKNFELYDPNAKKDNMWNFSFGNSLKEWAIIIKCSSDEIYHINKGDCISVSKNTYGGVEKSYSTQITIRTKTGHKSSAEKVRNALLYLMNVVKDKNYFKKENDNDPFASKNFNEKQFEIKDLNKNGSIRLHSKNGMYYINVSMGTISRKFKLDSGERDVLISKQFESDLINNGIIKKENYLTDKLYKNADGSVTRCKRVLIPKLTIGEFTILNVQATVFYSDAMILGKSVLDKFKSWKIDNLNKTLKLSKKMNENRKKINDNTYKY